MVVVVFLYMEILNTITKPVKNDNGSRKGCKNRISAVVRQTKVMTDIVNNGKPVTVAMRDNGYKAGYNPTAITKTKTWQELLARDLPDKLLTKIAKQGLKANGGDKYKDLEIRHKYLETSLKMTGKLREADNTAGLLGLVVGFKMVTPKDTAEVIEGEEVI